MVAVFVKLGLLTITTATGPSLLLCFTETNLFIQVCWVGWGGTVFYKSIDHILCSDDDDVRLNVLRCRVDTLGTNCKMMVCSTILY